MKHWATNRQNIWERFGADLCRALRIPERQIQVERVDRAPGLVYLRVRPPHGTNVVDRLNGNALDAKDRMEDVRGCLARLNIKVDSLTLGEVGLGIQEDFMDAVWDTTYWKSGGSDERAVHWKDPISQGNRPYYCPSQWKRYGIKVAKDAEEFDRKWGRWPIAYHGTRSINSSNILVTGLRVSTSGCFAEEGIPRVYVSPSIEYSAHPRYAFPWTRIDDSGEIIWYQLIFQCRVNPTSIDHIGPETLLLKKSKASTTVDSNFSNLELEWVIKREKGVQYVKDDIICYGMMIRRSSVDPDELKSSAWWSSAHGSDCYKKK